MPSFIQKLSSWPWNLAVSGTSLTLFLPCCYRSSKPGSPTRMKLNEKRLPRPILNSEICEKGKKRFCETILLQLRHQLDKSYTKHCSLEDLLFCSHGRDFFESSLSPHYAHKSSPEMHFFDSMTGNGSTEIFSLLNLSATKGLGDLICGCPPSLSPEESRSPT